MKKLLAGLVLVCTIFFISCKTVESVGEGNNNQSQKEEKEMSNHPFGISEENYKEILDKSLVSMGNNYRTKKFIEKLRTGKDVYIAALGGSVTEGAGPKDANGVELWKLGYAYQFKNKLVEKYTPDNGQNVHFDGAGLSGTPSTLGLIRYESDVVEVLGHTPDLLIIEFCVNNGGETMYARSYEALIRNALEANPECCVIALYSDAKSYKNSQADIIPVATFYRVPQISIQDTVESHKNLINEDEFFDDYVHPKKEGHEIMADCLMHMFDKADVAEAQEPFDIPDGYAKEPAFTNFKRILGDDENVKISVGSFSSTDAKCQTIKKTGKSNFPHNWYKEPKNSSEGLRMEINCKSLFLVYKVQGSWEPKTFGKADIFVDGKKVATYDGNADGGWNNCETKQIIDNEEASNHIVEVKMASGDEAKAFTIVAMGYSK